MAEDKHPQIIELSDKAKERIQRFKDFDSFYAKAIEFFEPFKQAGEREKYFEALHMLCVVPGSRAGACETNIVDIFWGQRLFDKEEGIDNGRRRVKFKSEYGATLFILKNDDGYVSIHLYPAHTETSRPVEDLIVWKSKINPSKLLSKSFQKKCWHALMAYMEVTSLDGDPSFCQKVYIWYLRHFKNVVVDKKETPIKALSFLKTVGTWVMTVGFSGLVIFLLQMWLQSNPAEHENIQDIKGSVQKVEQAIRQIQNEVTRIECNQNSINENQKALQQERVTNKKNK